MTRVHAWKGRCAYRPMLAAQRRYRDAILRQRAPEAVWALEHEPVITTGRRPVDGLPESSWCAERGVELCATERGGLATYHGPGQLVVYYLLDVRRLGGIRRLVCSIETGVVSWLRGRGIQAELSDRGRGVWVGDRKICAVGLHVRKGVTIHGMALNLMPDLGPYTWFSPCGFDRGSITSVHDQLGESATPEAVWREVMDATLKGVVDIQQPER